MYIYEQCFSLSACGARQMTEEWGELNINWHLVHSTRSFGLPMMIPNTTEFCLHANRAFRQVKLRPLQH
jgi:hypothetical protein